MPVFSLKEAKELQVKNVSENTFKYWGESAAYGYIAGGATPTVINTISRIDFSNETASAPGKNLPTATNNFSGTSSAFYGYFGGGSPPASNASSIIKRLDFSTENISLPGKNFPGRRDGAGAVSNSLGSYGYFGGGYTPPAITTSSVVRIDFSTENISIPTNNLTAGFAQGGTVLNSSYGYFAGGNNFSNATRISSITRLDFATETISAPGKNLQTAKEGMGGVYSPLSGYLAGGYITSPLSTVAVAEKIDFLTESLSSISNLPSIRAYSSGTSSSTYGYLVGGEQYPPLSVAYISLITRIDFSTDSVSNSGTNSPVSSSQSAALSGGASVYRGSKTYGYFGGGGQINGSSTIVKLDFSTENVSTLVNNLRFARYGLAATSSNFYGYFAGGFDPGVPTFYSVIDRLDFSNETISLPGKNLPAIANLPGARRGLTATLGNSYGYFGGGITPNGLPVVYVSIITRLDFSSETISDPGKNFPNTIGFSAATSSNAYGYFGGGYIFPPNFYSTITRLDFSSETISNPGKNLPTGIAFSATNSNNSYGYFIGGSVGPTSRISNINRLDLSSETLSSPGNNFPTVRANHTATSSNFYGYFGGGTTTVDVNTISRIDFSNETFSNPGKNLPQTNVLGAAVSNSN